jgi:hypothetical protein
MTTESLDFMEFPKIARYSRDCIVTEKIDGTNGQIYIGADGQFLVGSRTRWLTPETGDNHGFMLWALTHKDELLTLGPGRHFGEWWGQGIQRGYGLTEKRFSLFNVSRWCLHGDEPKRIPMADPRLVKMQTVLPACVGLVPVLWEGKFDDVDLDAILARLAVNGSRAAPGFMQPEGAVVFHTAGNVGFKKTILKDGEPKSVSK